jgi:hypothetical protein
VANAADVLMPVLESVSTTDLIDKPSDPLVAFRVIRNGPFGWNLIATIDAWVTFHPNPGHTKQLGDSLAGQLIRFPLAINARIAA